MNSVLINGQPSEQIGVTDRALHYGDGVFETIAVVNGSPRFWERHIKRMHAGCHRLGIPLPEPAVLFEELTKVAHNTRECVVKIIISRGSGGRGYRPPAVAQPTRLVMRYSYPDYPVDNATRGIAVRLCDTPLGCNPRLAGIKHLNRLEQVLARSEWADDAIAEGWMLDSEGHLIDGTMSNLFMVVDGVLHTPDLSRCGVEGVMRSVIVDIAQQHAIPLCIAPMKAEMLERADELFICNALMGIWPVHMCDEHHYSVGPITRKLQHILASLMESSHA